MHLVAHVHLYYVFLASTRYCKGGGIIVSLHTLCQTIRLDYFPPLCLW